MNLAQMAIVGLASAGVARAYASLGLVSLSMRWLNYAISCCAGLIGAWLALRSPVMQSLALVVSVFFSMAALTVYHLLRWYFDLLQERTHTAGADGEAEQQLFTVKANQT